MAFRCIILTALKRFASNVPSWFYRLRNATNNGIQAIANIDWKALAKAIWGWMKANPGKVALITAAMTLLGATPAILGAIGFTAAGPAAGSLAAAIQASIGTVGAGSLFAIIQSAAMGGYGVGVMWGAALGLIGAVCGIITAYWASFGRKMKTP